MRVHRFILVCLACIFICPVYSWAKNNQSSFKPSKITLKEAKRLAKEGWKTFDGDPTLAEQLEKSFWIQYEYDNDLYPKYISGEGIYTGLTLKEAELKTEASAKLDLCGNFMNELTALEEAYGARSVFDTEDIAAKQTYLIYINNNDFSHGYVYCMGQKVCEWDTNDNNPETAYKLYTDLADKTYMQLPHVKHAKTILKLYREVKGNYEVFIRVYAPIKSFNKIGDLYYYLDDYDTFLFYGNYEKLDTTKNTAEVTYHFNYSQLEDVTIPPKVVYKERTYDVIGVCDNAFWEGKNIKKVKYPVWINMSKAHLPDSAELIAYNPQPPLLAIEDGSLVFVDSTNNNRIDAEERSYIQFKMKNNGKGDAENCYVHINMTGTKDGITASSLSLPTIAVAQTCDVKIPIISDINTQDGKVTFSIEVVEPSGWGIAPFDLIVATKAYEPPYLQVVDYTISSLSGGVHQLEPFTCTFNLQNTQYGDAEDVKVKINLPNKDIYIVSGDTMLTYPIIKAGEKEMIQINLIANNNYNGSHIPVTIDIKEKHGKYAENKQINIELLKKTSTATEITVKEEKSKFKIISSQDMALAIAGTPRVRILTNTSVSILRPEWYNKYHNPQNIKSPFPYAVIQLELKGDKEAIEIAKQTLSLVMGGKHIVEAKDDKESNTIYFLVHCRNEYIDLDCGDGCEPINIWKERLEPNKVYHGSVSVSVQ